MEHWFDGLAKDLAARDASRRTFIGGIFATLGAVASVAVPGVYGMALAHPGPSGAPQSPSGTVKTGSCTLERSGENATAHHSIQTTFNGKALSHTLDLTMTLPTQKGQAPHITSTRTITLGGDPLVKVEKDSQGNSTQVKLTYGAAFQGVREVSYTTDGKVIQGTIDGQSIAPFTVGADPGSLKLAGGKTPPAVKLDPALESALSDLLKKTQNDISTCAHAAPGHSSSAGQGKPAFASNGASASGTTSAFATRLRSLYSMTVALAPVSPGFLSSWFAPEEVHAAEITAVPTGFGAGHFGTIPQNSSACQSCQNSCAATALVCDAGACGASAACFIFWGVCCAASLAACTVAGGVCLNNCVSAGTNTQPGGACCPVGCPNVDGCCYQNQQCSGTANVCCAENVVVCEGNCCPPGYVCKDGVCCTPNGPVCHGVCCADGKVCSNESICCTQLQLNTQPVSCSGTCCAAGQKCAKPGPNSQETCCPTEHICGGTCCPSGCVNGKCAPLCLVGIPCGTSCCAWGCGNAATNTCKPAQTCANGQSVCPAEQSGVSNLCCATGTGCFDGKCCPTGSVACIGKTTGTMGCWPQSQCVVQPPPK